MKKLIALCLLVILGVGAREASAGTNEDLLAACRTGNLDGATKAINAGAKVNTLDPDGNSALSWAFFWPEITRLLLSKGANPNLGGSNPVYQASANYSTEVLKLLLDAGGDPNRPTQISPSAIFRPLIAAEKAKGKAANQMMIGAWESAMKTLKPSEAYALQTTVYATSCVPCVELLLAKGARLDQGVKDGSMMHVFADSISPTPEGWKKGFAQGKTNMEAFGLKLPDWYAASLPADRIGTAEQMLKVLLGKGLNINEKNKGQNGLKPMAPLELSLNQGLGKKRELMLVLVANGADVKAVNEIYGPLILQAVQCGYVDVVKAMVEQGADINQQGNVFTDATETKLLKTFTPLTTAALKNQTEMVKYLVGAGARSELAVNGRHTIRARVSAGETTWDGTGTVVKTCLLDSKDRSALYFAIDSQNLELVKFLVENKGYDGRPYSFTAAKFGGCAGGGSYSPSAWAEHYQVSKEIVGYLKSKGL